MGLFLAARFLPDDTGVTAFLWWGLALLNVVIVFFSEEVSGVALIIWLINGSAAVQ